MRPPSHRRLVETRLLVDTLVFLQNLENDVYGGSGISGVHGVSDFFAPGRSSKNNASRVELFDCFIMIAVNVFLYTTELLRLALQG